MPKADTDFPACQCTEAQTASASTDVCSSWVWTLLNCEERSRGSNPFCSAGVWTQSARHRNILYLPAAVCPVGAAVERVAGAAGGCPSGFTEAGGLLCVRHCSMAS